MRGRSRMERCQLVNNSVHAAQVVSHSRWQRTSTQKNRSPLGSPKQIGLIDVRVQRNHLLLSPTHPMPSVLCQTWPAVPVLLAPMLLTVLLSPTEHLPTERLTTDSSAERRPTARDTVARDTVVRDTVEAPNDSVRADAYAELVHMLGALETLWEEADSSLPDYDPLWYEWEQLLSPKLLARRDSLMKVHSRRLTAIVAEHGLPPERNLSAPVEAAVVRAARKYPVLPNGPLIAWSASYILWRHSVDTPTQQQLLPAIIERQTADYEGRVRHVLEMSLTDRVTLRTDSIQVYGTQMCQIDGQMQYFPIRDRAFADRRRSEAGMRSLDDYLRESPCPDCRPCPAWARSQ